MDMKKHIIAAAAALCSAGIALPGHAGDLSANAAVTNNYIWRGLTQTENEAAVQGGIDYADDSGFYVGTWVSNVNYGAGDVFSYEHDVYAGYAFSAGGLDFDLGYLYYNYDDEANFDFAEVYGTVGMGGFSFTANLLAHTEADEVGDQDFGFGEAIYLSADYGFEVAEGLELGLHVGYHDGDFAEAFNGNDGDYYDYNISLSKGGFSFMISDTNVSGGADAPEFDNDSPKFVLSYAVDMSLM